jgi:hypothetical protein
MPGFGLPVLTIWKMEPQSTPKTQIRPGQDELDALSREIIGCALLSLWN